MPDIEYPEGATPLDPDELGGLKFKHVTTCGQLDHLEQANIQNGMRWLSRYKGNDVLNEYFVRELHKRLFGEVWHWAGTFRTAEKNIGIAPLQISVQLRSLMDDVIYWIAHNTFEPLELGARLHHKLVFIHPFSNGNGRHARIMADVVLDKILDEKTIDWSGGSDLQAMNKRRRSYISALGEADKGSFTPLLAFVGFKPLLDS
jgi:Fic-DOC domain mobile mystery protein B